MNLNIITFTEKLGIYIADFLDSKEESLELHVVSFALVREVLNDLEFEIEDDFETNGWDIDYSISFTHKDGTKLMVTGSWYYGNCTIEK